MRRVLAATGMSGTGRKRLSEGRRIAVIDEPYYGPNGSFSDLGLFRDLQRVIHLDPQVADRALEPMDCSP